MAAVLKTDISDLMGLVSASFVPGKNLATNPKYVKTILDDGGSLNLDFHNNHPRLDHWKCVNLLNRS